MRHLTVLLTFAVALLFGTTGCDFIDLPHHDDRGSPLSGSYEFSAPVFDIDATSNGSILVAETVPPETDIPPEGETSLTTVKEIRKKGVQKVVEISTVQGSPINGLAANGRGSFFATNGGVNQGVGAGLWRASEGKARKVADIEAFEQENDPDASEGPQWKNQACEENPNEGFTAGPQSNPYHLTRLTGSTALVADAAGNQLLTAKKNGRVDWVAVFTPPTRDGSPTASADSTDWRVLFPLNQDTNCYVQPVPNSVAIGPDGDYYVGELTGATAEGPPTGLSRVWRMESGAQHVTCPSDDCEVVLSGLTSALDLAFGPSGALYVVEYDENSWLAAESPEVSRAGGTINRCDVDAGTCEEVEGDLTFPGAVTVDKWDQVWVLENNLGIAGAPTVRRVNGS